MEDLPSAWVSLSNSSRLPEPQHYPYRPLLLWPKNPRVWKHKTTCWKVKAGNEAWVFYVLVVLSKVLKTVRYHMLALLCPLWLISLAKHPNQLDECQLRKPGDRMSNTKIAIPIWVTPAAVWSSTTGTFHGYAHAKQPIQPGGQMSN